MDHAVSRLTPPPVPLSSLALSRSLDLVRWQTREIRPIDVPVEQGRPSASRRLLLGFPQTRSRWTLCSRCTACWCAAAPHAASQNPCSPDLTDRP